jgi:serine protease AprX
MPRRPPRNDYVIIPVPLRVDADPSWTGKGVTIAFIDSGFYPHPALTHPESRIRSLIDVTPEKYSSPDFETVHASSWHGTMVACVACGNGYFSRGYYHGIAHGADVALIKVFDGKKIRSTSLLQAIRWIEKNAHAFGIRVVNISVGGDGRRPASTAICAAIRRLTDLGIVVVAAAGNRPDRFPTAPASCEDAITVGGIDDHNAVDGKLSEYGTSHGSLSQGFSKPDIVAPSNLLPAPMLPDNAVIRESEILHRLYKTPLRRLRTEIKKHLRYIKLAVGIENRPPKAIRMAIRERMTAEKFFAPYYQHVDGTSFAAPIVSSVIAQMLEVNPTLTPRTIKYILQKTARPLPDIAPVKQGAGLIAARRCVEWAAMEQDLEPRLDFPVVTDRRITFRLHAPEARHVKIAGDFTAWKTGALPLTLLDHGLWRIDIPGLSPGKYAYKFLIDGKWTHDPEDPRRVPDAFGGENNFLIVP